MCLRMFFCAAVVIVGCLRVCDCLMLFAVCVHLLLANCFQFFFFLLLFVLCCCWLLLLCRFLMSVWLLMFCVMGFVWFCLYVFVRACNYLYVSVFISFVCVLVRLCFYYLLGSRLICMRLTCSNVFRMCFVFVLFKKNRIFSNPSFETKNNLFSYKCCYVVWFIRSVNINVL